MKISVTDFSAPIGASVFKLCVHFQVDKVYCVLENKDTNSHFPFSNFHSDCIDFWSSFTYLSPFVAYSSLAEVTV